MFLNTLLDDLFSFISSPLIIYSSVFWILAFVLYYKLSKKHPDSVYLLFPFLILFKSRKFNALFKKIGKKSPKLWKIIWNVGVVVSFLFMLWALYFFITNFLALLLNPKPENALLPLIPGVTIDFPIFSYMIIPILITVTIHELSHAIAAENDNIKIISSGIFGAGLFVLIGFGAFVEIDDFELYSPKVKSATRLRVSAAGVWSNLILAGLILLTLTNFNPLMSVGYEREVFQINSVIPNREGGFNEKNLTSDLIVVEINGTEVDNNNGHSLSDFLQNKTSLKVHINDSLIFTCLVEDSHELVNYSVTVGFRPFIGFEYSLIDNYSIYVDSVYSSLIGGNNEGRVYPGDIIVQVGNWKLNYTGNATLESLLKEKLPPYTLNLTLSNGTIRNVYVDFYPSAPGAHVFRNVYLGIHYQKLNNSAILINHVYKNSTEGGFLEGILPENITIVKVNGTALNIPSNISFSEYLLQSYPNLKAGDSLVFTTPENVSYTIIAKPKPVRALFIGITEKSYWLPKNFIGSILGPHFPTYLSIELWFTWVISFSVALFNLLPTSIFDGGRMFKELLFLIYPPKLTDAKEKTLKWYYRKKEGKVIQPKVYYVEEFNSLSFYPLSHSSKKEKSFSLKSMVEYLPQEGKDLMFIKEDRNQDGYWDTLILEEEEQLPEEGIIEIKYLARTDMNEKKRKRIFQIVSSIIGFILIGSFVVSIMKFGTSIFWL